MNYAALGFSPVYSALTVAAVHETSRDALERVLREARGAFASGHISEGESEAVEKIAELRDRELRANARGTPRGGVEPLARTIRRSLGGAGRRPAQAARPGSSPGRVFDRVELAARRTVRFGLTEYFPNRLRSQVQRPSEQATLMAICWLASRRKGVCTAATATIAAMAGCAKSTAKQAIRRLVELQIIALEVAGGRGQRDTNTYRVIHALAQRVQRAREEFFARTAPWSSSKTGGPSSREDRGHFVGSEDKTLISNNIIAGGRKKTAPPAPEKRAPFWSFPTSGSIRYGEWAAIARECIPKRPLPDIDDVADKFRQARRKLGRPFEGERLRSEFEDYCRQVKK